MRIEVEFGMSNMLALVLNAGKLLWKQEESR